MTDSTVELKSQLCLNGKYIIQHTLCVGGFGITYKAFVLSAHRVPEKLEETLEQVEKEGCKVIIA